MGNPTIRNVAVDALIPDAANVRQRDERAKRTLKNSIAQFGPARSIVLDASDVVRAGNGTLEAFAAAGGTEVVVIDAEPGKLYAIKRPDWSPTEATAYAIADNRTAELASWDNVGLATTLRALESESFSLDAVGFTEMEVGDLCESIGSEIIDGAAPPGGGAGRRLPGDGPVWRDRDVRGRGGAEGHIRPVDGRRPQMQGGLRMRFEVHNRCSDFSSYRAARVKSLFNAESGCNFDLAADVPIDDDDWKIGLVVGPSGSGKTSVGRTLFGGDAFYEPAWPADRPIIDAIAPDGDFNDVTGALASVGLGDVPAWLRPYSVLSNGEKFRANLARLVSDAPATAVVDEFTSVVDRQIAKIGALAFQKAWRRTAGKCVMLSCHYDVVDWLEPDWVFDTSTRQYAGRRLWRRPKFDLEIWETDWRYWPLFEPHHYLKMPRMIAATCYVGTVDGEPVCHVAVSPRLEVKAMRACRLVVMPEWQGAGVGFRFLNWVCQHQIDGGSRWGKRVERVYFHTTHPGLVAALRRDPRWRQVSACLTGANKARSAASMRKSAAAKKRSPQTGYGGHFRAVQGFRYYGEALAKIAPDALAQKRPRASS